MLTEVQIENRMTAFVAKPGGGGKAPAVILLHERYGIDRHTKDLVQRIADAGYVGIAPDLFSRFAGDRAALSRGDARCDLVDDECIQDLGATIDYLKSLSEVDGERIAMIGVCQTGRQPLMLGAVRNDLSSIVVLYGGVGASDWEPNPQRPKSIAEYIAGLQCPVLGIFGEADHVIHVGDVVKFQEHLIKGRKSYDIRIYRDAPHGWLNDTMPGRYREEPAKHAWNVILGFLGDTFSDRWERDRVVWRFDSNISPNYDPSKNVRLA